MNNFVLNNPTKIIFGRNTVQSIGNETLEYGKHVLLISGQKSARDNGYYQNVVESLENTGCVITEFSGVSPNPTLDKVELAIEICLDNKCDVICAIGGGSVIDTAKAVGCGALVNHKVWKFFTTKKSIKATLPLLCVCTISGSGSENNSGMVITNQQTTEKFGTGSRFLYPRVSILDPETTFSVPPDLTSFGAVDTISHLLEHYLTTRLEDPLLQNSLAESIILSTMHNCELALENPRNFSARGQLMWSSALALSGIPTSGLGRIDFPNHLIEHSLSGMFNTPHGAGLAVIIPAWMRYVSYISPKRISRLGKGLFGFSGNSDKKIALETALSFEKWFKKIGCPVTLAELGIHSDEISRIAENTQSLAKIWRLNSYTAETVSQILQLA